MLEFDMQKQYAEFRRHRDDGIGNRGKKVFKTPTGIALLKSIYLAE